MPRVHAFKVEISYKLLHPTLKKKIKADANPTAVRLRFHEKLTEIAISHFSIHGYTSKENILEIVWPRSQDYSRSKDGDIAFNKMVYRELVEQVGDNRQVYKLTDKGWNYFYEKKRRALERLQIESVIKTNRLQRWSFWLSLGISIVALLISVIK